MLRGLAAVLAPLLAWYLWVQLKAGQVAFALSFATIPILFFGYAFFGNRAADMLLRLFHGLDNSLIGRSRNDRRSEDQGDDT